MNWTDIDNNVFGTGEPTAGIHLKQMNDNFVGMANGDVDAPKIQKAALSASVQASLDAADAFTAAPVAGSAFLSCQLGGINGLSVSGTDNTDYTATPPVSGNLRMAFNISYVQGVSGSTRGYARVKSLSGSTVGSQIEYSANTSGAQVIDFPCVKGERYFLQIELDEGVEGGASISASSTEIRTNNNVIGAL